MVVIEALRSVPEPQRQVLALHYLADLSVDDIAATLGIGRGHGQVTARPGTPGHGRGAGPSEGGTFDA